MRILIVFFLYFNILFGQRYIEVADEYIDSSFLPKPKYINFFKYNSNGVETKIYKHGYIKEDVYRSEWAKEDLYYSDIIQDTISKKIYFFCQEYQVTGYNVEAHIDKTYQSYYDEYYLCQTYIVCRDSNQQEKSLLHEDIISLSTDWGDKHDETGVCLFVHLFADTGGLDKQKMWSDDFVKVLRHSPHYYLFKYDWEGKKLWQTKTPMPYDEDSRLEDKDFYWVVGEKQALKNRQKIFVEKINRRTGKIAFSKLVEDIPISPPREEYYYYNKEKSEFRAIFSDQKGGVYLSFGGKKNRYKYFLHIDSLNKQTKHIQQSFPFGYAILLKKFQKNAPLPVNFEPQFWRGQAERAGGSLQMVEVAGQICYFAGTWALEKDRDKAFETLKIQFPEAEKVRVEDWKPVLDK